MTEVLSPSHSSLMDPETFWPGFDMSMVHPAHGLSSDAFAGTLHTMSAAEKLLASMEADEDEQEESEDDNSMRIESSSSSFGPATYVAAQEFPFCEDSVRQKSQELGDNPLPSPSIRLERTSSCFFSPPIFDVADTLAPFDASLERQLSQSASHSPTIPNMFASTSSTAIASSEMLLADSTSSMMVRSYSAPAHTQKEHEVLKQKWNAESACLLQTARAKRSNKMAARPALGRRATSTSTLAMSSISASRQAEAALEGQEDGASSLYASLSSPSLATSGQPYSSRMHLLSPKKGHGPFKRSRLTYVQEESTSASTSNSSSPANVAYRTSSPPKSPSRPGLNRYFTTPEFFVGDESDDSSEEQEASNSA